MLGGDTGRNRQGRTRLDKPKRGVTYYMWYQNTDGVQADVAALNDATVRLYFAR